MWRNAKNNQQQVEWMADSVTLSVSLFCFIHSLANRTKTECNVKQRLNGSNFFYYSFYFLLQHSTSFAFWAPPPSSTPSCRCDLEARGWEDTSSNVDHLRLASACAPALWADLAAILATEAAIWDLGVGWGNLGSGEEREGGAATWLDLPALCSDLSTIPRLGEQWLGGRERVEDEDATKLAAWYLSQSVRFERWVGRLLPSNDNQSHSAFVRSIDNSHFGRGPGRACWKVSSRALTSGWPRTLFLLDRHQEEVWWGEERQKKRQNVRSLDSQAPLTSCALDEHLMHSSLIALLPLMLMYMYIVQ